MYNCSSSFSLGYLISFHYVHFLGIVSSTIIKIQNAEFSAEDTPSGEKTDIKVANKNVLKLMVCFLHGA